MDYSFDSLREIDFVEAIESGNIQHSTPLKGQESTLYESLERNGSSSLAFLDVSETTSYISEDRSTDAEEPLNISRVLFNDFSESSFSSKPPSSCCSCNCIASLNTVELQQMQSSFSSRNRPDQRQFLFDIVIASAKRSENSSSIDGYVLFGKRLCKEAFITVMGISSKRLRTVCRLVQAGSITAKSKPINTRRATNNTEVACAWMESYFKRIGDRMPHTQQVHLPSFLSKLNVYHQMMDELTQQGLTDEKQLSLSHFYALWNKRFSYCIIPKVLHNSLYKIKICM